MQHAKYAWFLLVLAAIADRAHVAALQDRQVHQAPDKDGVYYPGPKVNTPRPLRTVYVTHPEAKSAKELQGMTVLAMVAFSPEAISIDFNCLPGLHLQYVLDTRLIRRFQKIIRA